MTTLSGIDVACPACGDAVPVTYSAVLMPPSGGVAEVALVPNIGTLRAHMATHDEPEAASEDMPPEEVPEDPTPQ